MAPRTGIYALTTEWETTSFSVRCNKGERFPPVAVADEEPHWFVLVGVPTESVQAA